MRMKAERRNYRRDEGGCLWDVHGFGTHWTKAAEVENTHNAAESGTS